jgi:heavy metal translocating P-type ATPase
MIGWPVAALAIIAGGAVVQAIAGPREAHWAWMAGLAACAAPIVFEMLRDARRGEFATDIVAALAIVGAILLSAPIAGLVVVIMLRGGEGLERYAEGRASAAVRTLEEAAPRIAHRMQGMEITDIDVADIAVGDILLVRPGELVPCDGEVVEGASDIDTSSITGEPVPVGAVPGTPLMSGFVNGTGVLRMRATALAAESQYERIVELVRSAQSHKAPLQRLADRYAVWFTPVTLAVCAATFALTRDWTRVLSVLVVATPCPLILATPVAFIGGINRAARRHVIVRNGGAIEYLSRVTTVVLDKTGTITLGEPKVERVRAVAPWTADEVLGLAASVEQGSSHRLARTVVAAAHQAGLTLAAATSQREEPGRGVSGTIGQHVVHVGAKSYVLPSGGEGAEGAELEAGSALLRSYVGIDGRLAGTVEYAEELRADLGAMLASLRGSGITKIILLSGDHAANVRAMGEQAGITDVRGDLLPEDKARIVDELERAGEVVLMVGDGTNDAPALTRASVGVALAGHGGGITAEAADVIVLQDSLAAVSDVLAIGARTTRIAKESIRVGLMLSGAAMVWAAAGGIRPVAGAMLQEAIDVAVILNALRTIRGGA